MMKKDRDARRYFRFPVFDDDEGVKLSNRPRRILFQEDDDYHIPNLYTPIYKDHSTRDHLNIESRTQPASNMMDPSFSEPHLTSLPEIEPVERKPIQKLKRKPPIQLPNKKLNRTYTQVAEQGSGGFSRRDFEDQSDHHMPLRETTPVVDKTQKMYEEATTPFQEKKEKIKQETGSHEHHMTEKKDKNKSQHVWEQYEVNSEQLLEHMHKSSEDYLQFALINDASIDSHQHVLSKDKVTDVSEMSDKINAIEENLDKEEEHLETASSIVKQDSVLSKTRQQIQSGKQRERNTPFEKKREELKHK